MARTKQTPRMGPGCKAPRLQVAAVSASSRQSSSAPVQATSISSLSAPFLQKLADSALLVFPKYQAILEDLQNEALVKLVQRIKDDETEKLDSVWNEVRSTWEGEEFRQGKSKVILKRKIENNHKLSGQLWAKYFKAVEYALEDSNIGPHDCEYDPRGSSEVNQSDECYKLIKAVNRGIRNTMANSDDSVLLLSALEDLFYNMLALTAEDLEALHTGECFNKLDDAAVEIWHSDGFTTHKTVIDAGIESFCRDLARYSGGRFEEEVREFMFENGMIVY